MAAYGSDWDEGAFDEEVLDNRASGSTNSFAIPPPKGPRKKVKTHEPCIVCLDPASRRSVKHRWGACCRKDVEAAEVAACSGGEQQLQTWNDSKQDDETFRECVLAYKLKCPSKGPGCKRGHFDFVAFHKHKFAQQGVRTFVEGEWFSEQEYVDHFEGQKKEAFARAEWLQKKADPKTPRKKVGAILKLGVILHDEFQIYKDVGTSNTRTQSTKAKNKYTAADLDQMDKSLYAQHEQFDATHYQNVLACDGGSGDLTNAVGMPEHMGSLKLGADDAGAYDPSPNKGPSEVRKCFHCKARLTSSAKFCADCGLPQAGADDIKAKRTKQFDVLEDGASARASQNRSLKDVLSHLRKSLSEAENVLCALSRVTGVDCDDFTELGGIVKSRALLACALLASDSETLPDNEGRLQKIIEQFNQKELDPIPMLSYESIQCEMVMKSSINKLGSTCDTKAEFDVQLQGIFEMIDLVSKLDAGLKSSTKKTSAALAQFMLSKVLHIALLGTITICNYA